MNQQAVRRQYLDPIMKSMIVRDVSVDEMAKALNELGTKDRQHNYWRQPAIEMYLKELGFHDYLTTH